MNLRIKSIDTVFEVYQIWQYRQTKFENWLHFAKNGEKEYSPNKERYEILLNEMNKRMKIINSVVKNINDAINVNYL